jgi:hypothetical protein
MERACSPMLTDETRHPCMKKPIATLACLLWSIYAYGQGTIAFDTSVAPNGMIYSMDGKPATTAYAGQLYGSTTLNGSYTALGSPVDFFGDTVEEGAGFIIGPIITVPGSFKGDTYFVELHSWYKAKPSSEFGSSAPLQLTLGGAPADGSLPGLPATLENFKGFTLVPEPSTMALGLLGAVALLSLRRK